MDHTAVVRLHAVEAAAADGWRVRSVRHRPCWGPRVQGICRVHRGKLACSIPHSPTTSPGSLEERARARYWLMMNVSHDWEEKSNCICPGAALFLHHHNNTPTSSHYSPSGTPVKSAELNTTVQTCGQPTEVPKIFLLPKTVGLNGLEESCLHKRSCFAQLSLYIYRFRP